MPRGARKGACTTARLLVSGSVVLRAARLLQILVMSFPDKYHVLTLREVLDTCLLLQPGVELDKILCALIGRMTDHAGQKPTPQPIADRSAFHMFLAAARESGIRCALPPRASPPLPCQPLALPMSLGIALLCHSNTTPPHRAHPTPHAMHVSDIRLPHACCIVEGELWHALDPPALHTGPAACCKFLAGWPAPRLRAGVGLASVRACHCHLHGSSRGGPAA